MYLHKFLETGAMAERTKLESYCVVSLFNTIIYCFPAHWAWAEEGVFYKMGAIDIAGAGKSQKQKLVPCYLNTLHYSNWF